MKNEIVNPALISVPNSLREQLEKAQNLLSQSEYAEDDGNHSLAVVKAREAMQVVQRIAQLNPEVAALIILGEMGYRGFEYEIVDRVEHMHIFEKKFLGISFGQDIVIVPAEHRRTVRGRLF